MVVCFVLISKGKIIVYGLLLNLQQTCTPYSVFFISVAQLGQTLCDLMDYTPPGSSLHGIFQARILEWVAIQKVKCTQSLILIQAPLNPLYHNTAGH